MQVVCVPRAGTERHLLTAPALRPLPAGADTRRDQQPGSGMSLCALEALPLECSARPSRAVGLSHAPHVVEVLTLFSMCKLSPSKAFRRTCTDRVALRAAGAQEAGPSLPGAGPGRSRGEAPPPGGGAGADREREASLFSCVQPESLIRSVRGGLLSRRLSTL